MLSLNPSKISIDEYLDGEVFADVRHEYIAGDVFAMAGASERHNRIALNIAFGLRTAARGGHCGVFISDMKLRTETSKDFETCFYYPDVMLVCDDQDDQPNYKKSPCLVAEVLSPSTQAIDKREKLIAYKNIPSLRYYLLISSMESMVKVYQRDAQNQWQAYLLTAKDTLQVDCGDYRAELDLAAIYEDVNWTQDA